MTQVSRILQYSTLGRLRQGHGDHNVVIVNPLGAALAHYTASLESLLRDCGAVVRVATLVEPSTSGQRREQWVIDYLKLLRQVARDSFGARIILVWPVLGYWDISVARVTMRHLTPQVVVHDPEPLNRAVGYGRIARRLSGFASSGPAIVHSRLAARVVREQTTLPLVELPLPMFQPRQHSERDIDSIVVRVLGQYKPDRDIQAMERLAAEGPADWRYEVVGRGWPHIAGWNVRDQFVRESEFDALIRSSHTVLIPYRRFFQSDVAVRCLELGTPIVGPRDSSLQSLVGEGSSWLVTNDQWLPSTIAAIDSSDDQVGNVAVAAYNEARSGWAEWLVGSRQFD